MYCLAFTISLQFIRLEWKPAIHLSRILTSTNTSNWIQKVQKPSKLHKELQSREEIWEMKRLPSQGRAHHFIIQCQISPKIYVQVQFYRTGQLYLGIYIYVYKYLHSIKISRKRGQEFEREQGEVYRKFGGRKREKSCNQIIILK